MPIPWHMRERVQLTSFQKDMESNCHSCYLDERQIWETMPKCTLNFITFESSISDIIQFNLPLLVLDNNSFVDIYESSVCGVWRRGGELHYLFKSMVNFYKALWRIGWRGVEKWNLKDKVYLLIEWVQIKEHDRLYNQWCWNNWLFLLKQY